MLCTGILHRGEDREGRERIVCRRRRIRKEVRLRLDEGLAGGVMDKKRDMMEIRKMARELRAGGFR